MRLKNVCVCVCKLRQGCVLKNFQSQLHSSQFSPALWHHGHDFCYSSGMGKS